MLLLSEDQIFNCQNAEYKYYNIAIEILYGSIKKLSIPFLNGSLGSFNSKSSKPTTPIIKP